MCTYLAAVVLHQCCSHIHMVTCAQILSGLFEDGATRLDALRPPGKLHVLNVDQRGVDVLDAHQFVVDAVNFLVLHAAL